MSPLGRRRSENGGFPGGVVSTRRNGGLSVDAGELVSRRVGSLRFPSGLSQAFGGREKCAWLLSPPPRRAHSLLWQTSARRPPSSAAQLHVLQVWGVFVVLWMRGV